jgi:hypothetical protein
VPHKSAAPLLLDLFRYHARNVLAAIGVTLRSPLQLPSLTYCPVMAGPGVRTSM